MNTYYLSAGWKVDGSDPVPRSTYLSAGLPVEPFQKILYGIYKSVIFTSAILRKCTK